jgi:hypothetical protein
MLSREATHFTLLDEADKRVLIQRVSFQRVLF